MAAAMLRSLGVFAKKLRFLGLNGVKPSENLRAFTTSSCSLGKRNFRKFPLYNKRGTKDFKVQQKEDPRPEVPFYTRGVREVGLKIGHKFHIVEEMIPEIVVPSLEGFKLKPYVSYRAPDVIQSKFTAKDLFDAVYSEKIVQDHEKGKLDEDGNPLEPNEAEKLTPEDAYIQARKTGSDLH